MKIRMKLIKRNNIEIAKDDDRLVQDADMDQKIQLFNTVNFKTNASGAPINNQLYK